MSATVFVVRSGEQLGIETHLDLAQKGGMDLRLRRSFGNGYEGTEGEVRMAAGRALRRTWWAAKGGCAAKSGPCTTFRLRAQLWDSGTDPRVQGRPRGYLILSSHLARGIGSAHTANSFLLPIATTHNVQHTIHLSPRVLLLHMP